MHHRTSYQTRIRRSVTEAFSHLDQMLKHECGLSSKVCHVVMSVRLSLKQQRPDQSFLLRSICIVGG